MKISQQDPPDRYKSCNNKNRPQQKSRHHVLNHFQQVGLNKIIQCKEIQGEKSFNANRDTHLLDSWAVQDWQHGLAKCEVRAIVGAWREKDYDSTLSPMPKDSL